jgi:hypothetical protein
MVDVHKRMKCAGEIRLVSNPKRLHIRINFYVVQSMLCTWDALTGF